MLPRAGMSGSALSEAIAPARGFTRPITGPDAQGYRASPASENMASWGVERGFRGSFSSLPAR